MSFIFHLMSWMTICSHIRHGLKASVHLNVYLFTILFGKSSSPGAEANSYLLWRIVVKICEGMKMHGGKKQGGHIYSCYRGIPNSLMTAAKYKAVTRWQWIAKHVCIITDIQGVHLVFIRKPFWVGVWLQQIKKNTKRVQVGVCMSCFLPDDRHCLNVWRLIANLCYLNW